MKRVTKNIPAILLAACTLSLAACNQSASNTSTTSTMTDSTTQATLPSKTGFEKTIDGKPTHLYILKK